MNVNSSPHRSQNQITALFEAGVFTIDISGATTFGELATRLTDLGDQHHDTLTAIRVRKTSRSSTLSRALGLGAARVSGSRLVVMTPKRPPTAPRLQHSI